MRLRLAFLGIILAAAALYLIGNSQVGLFDRDEPRYAQTSRQMLTSNDWIVPKLLDDVRTAKPVFIYWCQAASMKLLGDTPFAARLPSAIAMVLTLSMLAVVLPRIIGPQRALWAVFILATAGLTFAAAKMCITDAVLLLWITTAQLCLLSIYRGQATWPIAIVMWIAVGLAGLTKGPVIIGVQLSTVLVLAALDIAQNRRTGQRWWSAIAWWRRTHPILGLLIVAAIVGPWLLAIERRAPGFLKQTLTHDVWTRTIRPLEGHKGPPGFHLLFIWATYFPWSLLLPTTLVLAFKNRRLSVLRFCLAAVIGPWIVFEIVQTKLVHYMLPAFPPLAILTADALVRCIRKQHDDLHRPLFVKVAAGWAVVVAIAGSALWLSQAFAPLPQVLYIAMAAMSLVGLAYAFTVFSTFRARRIAAAAAIMGCGMALIVSIFYGLFLPNADFLWLPQRIATVLKEHGASTKGDVFMIDFKEDSLAFYQGGTIRPRDDDFLLKEHPDNWGTWIVLTRDVLKKLPLPVISRLKIITPPMQGFAYADGGRIVEVLIVRKGPIPDPDPPTTQPTTQPFRIFRPRPRGGG